MSTPLLEALRKWRDFYALIGTASATLVALMFVAASIGAGVFTREHQAGIRSFLSPTVVHFSTVLIICLLATIPTETWAVLGDLLTCAGVIGLAYSGWIWRRRRCRLGRVEHEVRDMLGDAVVQAEVAALHMLEHERCRHHLGYRTDLKQQIRIGALRGAHAQAVRTAHRGRGVRCKVGTDSSR